MIQQPRNKKRKRKVAYLEVCLTKKRYNSKETMPLDSSDNQRNETDTLRRLTFNLHAPIYTSLFTVIALLWFPQYSLEQCKHGNPGSRSRQIFFSFLQDYRTGVLLLF
mmetsp:Transcript_28654/g.51877  ORF Transcript_28654/g.51877 Transcript_28654/m.51877 type:complete len:108 (-) Transcript_28654:1138-1461(-)